MVLWRGPCSTQRQVRELISGPNLVTRARLLSINRAQSRVVIGNLTRHNTLRRHLYVMGLSNNPACRICGTEENISVHVLCECEVLASLRHTHLGITTVGTHVLPCFGHTIVSAVDCRHFHTIYNL